MTAGDALARLLRLPQPRALTVSGEIGNLWRAGCDTATISSRTRQPEAAVLAVLTVQRTLRNGAAVAIVPRRGQAMLIAATPDRLSALRQSLEVLT